jgi:hypothetical protein
MHAVCEQERGALHGVRQYHMAVPWHERCGVQSKAMRSEAQHAHRILSNSRVKVLLTDVGGILSTALGHTHGKRCGARTRLLSEKEDDDDHYQDGGDGGDGGGDDTSAHT